jgi:hypothetical protein
MVDDAHLVGLGVSDFDVDGFPRGRVGHAPNCSAPFVIIEVRSAGHPRRFRTVPDTKQ